MPSQGVSLYLTIVILSVLMTALLALITISVSQIKIIWALGDSVIAFYAADTGIEHSLYNRRQQDETGEVSGTIGEAAYSVIRNGSTTYTSLGEHKQTKRAIEITY